MLLLICAVAVFFTSGIAALACARWPRVGSGVGAVGAVVGSCLGALPTVDVLRGTLVSRTSSIDWSAPYGRLVLGVDPLSAFFLAPLLVLGAAGAVYAHGYLDGARGGGRSVGSLWFAYNLLVGSMALVLLARDGLLLLVAWEAMALAAYLAVSWDERELEVHRAGWVYLIATHTGTALLIALVLLLGRRAGSLEFDALRAAAPPTGGALLVLFALAALGFGAKAGFVPLHVWLPEAHAAAPSHVSALMSGVLIKMGIYGVLRTLTLLGPPASWWGPTLVVIGLAGGLMGIALAAYQRDLKRALAYSSVENVGIVTLGLGIGFWGLTTGRSHVASLGFLGGLLHVWNHALMKGAMFLCAGSVVHGTGTKDLEKLGGLMARMPFTGTSMTLGAVAIAALPPLNGFVSEWLIYLGLIYTGLDRTAGVGALLAIGLLSLIGGMTALAFVRLIGIALLGEPRSAAAERAHESSRWMTLPIALLVTLCVALGLVPALLLGALGRVADQVAGTDVVAVDRASLWHIGACNAGVWAAIGLSALVGIVFRHGKPAATDSTWACGYADPNARMQYTARSFVEIAAVRLLPARLGAEITRPETGGLMPPAARFACDDSDPMTRGFYQPFLDRWAGRFARLRWMQQGALHAYLVYILAMVVAGLGWASIRAWMRG